MCKTEVCKPPEVNTRSEDKEIIIQQLQHVIEKIKAEDKAVNMDMITEKLVKIIDGKPIKMGVLLYNIRLKIEDDESPVIEYYKTYQRRYDAALAALEKAGWPCRLEELPSKYIETCRKLAELEDKLNAKPK